MSLRERIATPDGKRRYVRSLFATIADRYDLITVLFSYGQDQRWKRRLVNMAAPQPNARVLDLATGTGDIAFASAERGARVVGLDITLRMIELANAKANAKVARAESGVARGFQPRDRGLEKAAPQVLEKAAPQVAEEAALHDAERAARHNSPLFLVGDMIALPFPARAFDLVTTGYGLRNVPNLGAAIDEIARVLTPGGQLLSLDFNRPSNGIVRAAYLAYLGLVGGAVGWLLHRDPDTYRYIPASIRQYPGAAAVARMFEARGFARVRCHRVLGGLMTIHHAIRD